MRFLEICLPLIVMKAVFVLRWNNEVFRRGECSFDFSKVGCTFVFFRWTNKWWQEVSILSWNQVFCALLSNRKYTFSIGSAGSTLLKKSCFYNAVAHYSLNLVVTGSDYSNYIFHMLVLHLKAQIFAIRV